MSQPFDPNQPPPPQEPYAGGAPSPYLAAPQVNPYGGQGQAFPGSKAYVEQQFGPVAGFGARALALIIDTLLSLMPSCSSSPPRTSTRWAIPSRARVTAVRLRSVASSSPSVSCS